MVAKRLKPGNVGVARVVRRQHAFEVVIDGLVVFKITRGDQKCDIFMMGIKLGGP